MTDSLTIALDDGALDRLADPSAVIRDSKRFARHVGVISGTMGYQAASKLTSIGVDRADFLTRLDREEGLRQVKAATDTERYVYIGTDLDDAERAISTGWEYLDVRAAADDADWDCLSSTDTS